LFPPCLFFFVGVLIFRDWHSEPVLIGVGSCAAALAWFVIAVVQVARLLRVEAPASRPGFPVIEPPSWPIPTAG
jgi:hypothetical protein